MSNRSEETVADSLRPVVIVVVASKAAIIGFLIANMAGFVPVPAATASPTEIAISAEPAGSIVLATR